ncbi:MAG: hypothetical protein IKK39_04775 [Thermoguttaceae bacterium]|nr:hypothetical protein [Thermoguttaceae bacterium]
MAFNVCTICVGYNYGTSGELTRQDRATCELFQRRCQVAAWFKTQQFKWKKEKGEPFSVDEIDDMKGALLYYKNCRQLGFQNNNETEENAYV